jgi:hypothetical protein
MTLVRVFPGVVYICNDFVCPRGLSTSVMTLVCMFPGVSTSVMTLDCVFPGVVYICNDFGLCVPGGTLHL